MEAEMEAEKAVLSFQIMSEFEDQSSPIRADKVTIKPKELSSPGKLAIEIEEKKMTHEIDNKVETEDKCNIIHLVFKGKVSGIPVVGTL